MRELGLIGFVALWFVYEKEVRSLTWVRIAILSFEGEDCEVEQDNESGRVRVSMPTWIHGIDESVTGRSHHRYFHFFNSFAELVAYVNDTLKRQMGYDAVLGGTLRESGE
jgi:hypothetical protein